MRKQLIVSAALASLLAGSALAQSSKTIDPDKLTTGSAMNKTDTMHEANAPAKFGTSQSATMTSSKVVGATVYNSQNEKIGEVEDFALENGKTIDGIVVSVGGFLGIGEKYVLVEPQSISFRNDGGTWKAVMNTDKATLKSAPKFTYKSDKS